MGQKVHPLGFRVGITKKHQSQWFARFNKNKYAQSVLEDRMLRQTLTSLFPQLLNPSRSLYVQKRDDDGTVIPKITQIKIERGLIPYEIGIQIHAENCSALKASIENLKVNRELVCKLQKARRYLQHLRLKLNEYNNEQTTYGGAVNLVESTAKKQMSEFTNVRRRPFRGRPRLTKQQLRRQRLIQKRLRKRLSIRRRYNQLMSKGLFLTKKGNKIVQKLTLKNSTVRFKNEISSGKGAPRTGSGRFSRVEAKRVRGNVQAKFNKRAQSIVRSTTFKGGLTQLNILKTRVKRKFVNIYINMLNKKFLSYLKTSMKYWHDKFTTNGTQNMKAPLGWSKKWSLTRLKKLQTKTVSTLTKFITVLEQKAAKKLASLKKYYIAYGSLTKIQSFGYYQIITFLKHLKELVTQLKRKQKLQYALTNTLNLAKQKGNSQLTIQTEVSSRVRGAAKFIKANNAKTLSTLRENVLANKLNNLDDECRKIQFLEYLKQIVKKHRTENIYYYLSTIADARKDLRKLQKFTKRHASFLFGLTLPTSSEKVTSTLEQKVTERVSRVLENSSMKNGQRSGEKTLQDIFLEQIEKQRTMHMENAQLTPKIAIKFYSVQPKALVAKASVVADSIVDALEKRKAFRKVIKDAKEELMRTSGVKGVKIQVSGRLNGAEIARSEWVRAGRVPLQTLRANLDYSYKTASTIYGIIGVRVWIFKGYTKLVNK
jgi:ribosomal protein S3